MCFLMCQIVRTVQECMFRPIFQKHAREQYAPYCSAFLTGTNYQLAAIRSNALLIQSDKTECCFSSHANLWNINIRFVVIIS